MATLLTILIFIAFFHFIYESIIAPGERLKLRYKLFELRDQLREIYTEDDSKKDIQEFHVLDEAICTVIYRLPNLTISSNIEANKAYNNNSNFQRQVERTKELFVDCKDERVIAIHDDIMKIGNQAILVNSGGWSYIAIPLLVVLVVLGLIFKSIGSIKNQLFANVYKATYAPENNFSRFAGTV